MKKIITRLLYKLAYWLSPNVIPNFGIMSIQRHQDIKSDCYIYRINFAVNHLNFVAEKMVTRDCIKYAKDDKGLIRAIKRDLIHGIVSEIAESIKQF